MKEYILRKIRNGQIHITKSKFSYGGRYSCGSIVYSDIDKKINTVPEGFADWEDFVRKSTKICTKCCKKLIKEFGGLHDEETYIDGLLRIFKERVEVKMK